MYLAKYNTREFTESRIRHLPRPEYSKPKTLRDNLTIGTNKPAHPDI